MKEHLKQMHDRNSSKMSDVSPESIVGSQAQFQASSQTTAQQIPYEDICRSLIPVNCLSSRFQDSLLCQAELIDLKAGQTLFLQGEQDLDFFYLLSGSIEFISDQYDLNNLNAGTKPARFALDQFISEQLSVKAVTTSAVLRVNRDLLQRLLEISSESDVLDDALGLVDPVVDPTDHWLADFLQTELMTRLPVESMRKFFGQLETLLVRTGDQIVAHGMLSDYYYIVREGRGSVYYFNHSSGKKITLAELGSGDYFGEETELDGDRHCNPVKMLSNGVLLRLAKVDYNDLLNSESYQTLSFADASNRVAEGAHWLDVRFEYEHLRNGIHDSLNISLDRLSGQLDNLAKDQQYIVYCDSGMRSSAATTLMVEEGFDAVHLEGGIRKVFRDKEMSEEWIDGFSDRLRGKEAYRRNVANVAAPSATAKEISSIGEQMTEIDHRIRGLKQLFTIPDDQLDQSEIPTVEFDYHSEAGAEDLSVLIEARKRIDNQQSTKDTQAEDGESGLGLLRQQLENAQHQLSTECTKDKPANAANDRQSQTLQHVTNELEEIKNKLKEQESFELKRRQSFEHQLVTERKKMSEQLARFSSGIEQQQSRSLEIEKVKQLAVQETRMLIDRFKMAHEEYRQRHALNIQKVRKQLQQQANHVLDKARSAQIEKAEALTDLREVQRQLDELRQQRDLETTSQSTVSDVPLLLDIESMDNKNDSLDAPMPQENMVLEEVEQDEKAVHNNFVDWFESNDRFNLDREQLTEEQKSRLKRLKKIAHEALEEAFSGKQYIKD